MEISSEDRQAEIVQEIERWRGFAKVLRTIDKEAFDAAMDSYRRLASDCAADAGLLGFEQMMLSITTNQMAKMSKLETRLDKIWLPQTEPQTEEDLAQPAEQMIPHVKLPPKKTQRGLSDFG